MGTQIPSTRKKNRKLREERASIPVSIFHISSNDVTIDDRSSSSLGRGKKVDFPAWMTNPSSAVLRNSTTVNHPDV